MNRRRRQILERLMDWGITTAGLTGIGAVILILVFVAKEALPLFTDPALHDEVNLSKMFPPQMLREGRPPGFMWQPVSSVPKFSMIPLVLGTLKVTFIALTLAVPLALGAALFTAEFVPRRVREWLKPSIEILAGIPSVVLGFLALMVVATPLQAILGLPTRLNAALELIALAVAIIPLIFTVAEDALTSVPRSYREAALALGATRWETAWQVVLPAASPGVFAAIVLGLGRAMGETMIVLMASGNAAIVSGSLGDSVRTMSATLAAETGEVVVGSPHYATLFFIGVELFLLTFFVNLFATLWIGRFTRRLTGRGAQA